MRGPSLQKTAALSAVLHLTVFLLSFLILQRSSRMSMPSPYIVSLVGPASEQPADSLEEGEAARPEAGTSALDKDDAVGRKNLEIDQKRIDDMIAAIAAKKNMEKIARLKKQMVQIRGRDDHASKKTAPQARTAGTGRGSPGTGSYTDKITGEIWKEWVFPDTGEKNLETILSVRIMKDGSITVQGVEKSSGNILFDRSALKAVAKASPITPPPYEMELGIRFFP